MKTNLRGILLMKKNMLKKVLAIIFLSCCFIGIGSAVAEQPTSLSSKECSVSVSPAFIAIIEAYNFLDLNAGGRLTCEGYTIVQMPYIAHITMELQQYSGGWSTIKSWEETDTTSALLASDWYVPKGYQYRLRLTHKALNSNNSTIETFISYSRTVNYM